MLDSNESIDSFQSCDSFTANIELDYSIWRNEPESVIERRNTFFQEMGFTEFLHSLSHSRWHSCSSFFSHEEINNQDVVVTCSKSVEFQRTTSSSTAVSSSRICELRPPHMFDRNTTPLCSNARQDIWNKDKIKSWWNRFIHKRTKEGSFCKSDVSSCKVPKTNRMKVRHKNKRCKEFTALYMGQEIQAHKGFISTMKFSPDGRYLATGGEDGVVRIWLVTFMDTSPANATWDVVHKVKRGKLIHRRNSSKRASVVIPRKVFKIEESPLQELHGHTSHVLDLCWSNSNRLLSSSKDKTVRLWQVGLDDCLQVFGHNNYVTCIQFNPVDDGYFISGSIDGKVRIWGISENRVVDWADVRDIITAICYQPDGQGFVVGSITGHCRFYQSLGNNLQLDAQISVPGRKKSSNRRITGFQFSPDDSRRVMITSADSKVRIFDGVDIIHKYRGLRKSGSQMSASFTSNGRHIVSLGEDSRVYVWNYDGLCVASSKHAKTVRSCEHFFLEGVSVAIPWLGREREPIDSNCPTCSKAEPTSYLVRDSESFSLGGCFSIDGRQRGSTTWPEEKLHLWDVTVEDHDHHHPDHQQEYDDHYDRTDLSTTWGQVIMTGGCDGVIRTFHNYGLPVRL